jgi:tRNA A-37 threonylcarbamoyl transferase component Bud32
VQQPNVDTETNLRLPSVPGYELERELGYGAMGVVYKALHVGLNRTVALKMIRAGELASREALRRFKTEARAIAKLSHPNIIQVYDTGEAGGLPYLAMEYVGAGTLQDHLGEGRTVADALRVAGTLARAVQKAHEAGIVHRDLKPANVLLSQSGELKIADFGLAKDMTAERQTLDGQQLGTPAFMAPEQAEGRVTAVGPASDVYSLGAILFALLTGQPPFKGDNIAQTLAMVLYQAPAGPAALRPDVPAEVDAICLKCLAKDPAVRYQSAAELADALAAAPTEVRPEPVAEEAPKPAPAPRRRRHLALAGGVLLAAAAVVLLFAAIGRSRPDPEPEPVPPQARSCALLVAVDTWAEPPPIALPAGMARRTLGDLAGVLPGVGFGEADTVFLRQGDGPAREPTAARIREHLQALRGAGPEDVVVVALCGFGCQTGRPGNPPTFHFLPPEGRVGDPASMISQDEIENALAACPARVKLLVVDADRVALPAPPGRAGGMVRAVPSRPVMDRVAAFYSCSPGQQRCWSDADGYLFTRAVALSLRGDADLDADGEISLENLTTFVDYWVGAEVERVKDELRGRRVIRRGPSGEQIIDDGALRRDEAYLMGALLSYGLVAEQVSNLSSETVLGRPRVRTRLIPQAPYPRERREVRVY